MIETKMYQGCKIQFNMRTPRLFRDHLLPRVSICEAIIYKGLSVIVMRQNPL